MLKNFTKNRQKYPIMFYAALVFFIFNLIKFILLYIVFGASPVLEFFWFCNFFAFAISFSVLFLNIENLRRVSTVILCMAIPAQSFWIIGFILDYLNIIHLERLQNFSNLMQNNPSNIDIIMYTTSFVEHITLIPICILITYTIGFHKNAYKALFLTVFIFLTFSFIITPDYINLNCMHFECDSIHTKDASMYTYDFLYYAYAMSVWFLMSSLIYFLLKKKFSTFIHR